MSLTAGFLVVLPRAEAKVLFGKKEDDSLIDYVNELLTAETTRKVGCQGKWQQLHDTLAGIQREDSVLSQCILGGRPLHHGDEYHVCMVRPDVVRYVVDQGAQLDEPQVGPELWELTQAALGLYGEAAKVGGAVIFIARR